MLPIPADILDYSRFNPYAILIIINEPFQKGRMMPGMSCLHLNALPTYQKHSTIMLCFQPVTQHQSKEQHVKHLCSHCKITDDLCYKYREEATSDATTD